MKHKIFKTLLAVVAATMTFCAEAATQTVNGIEWTYTVKDGKASIESGVSSILWGNAAIPRSTSGAITIPSTLGGYPVTSIGEWAFNDCSSLTSVTIPNSVKSIGRNAFKGCKSLTSVTIPNSVTSIRNGAFYDCSSLTSVTIPNSVTSIGGYAFYDCSSLASVTIPNSVKSVGDSAFKGCSSLTSVTIPNSVTSIGIRVFDGCNDRLYDLKTIPGVKLVDGWAIKCEKTLSGDLNLAGVRGIACGAFWGCSSLTSVTIPNSVTSIGDEAFEDCSSLTSVTIPNSVTSIGYEAFEGCKSLASVTIPNSVTRIEWGVFFDCKSLTSVTIPNSVTSIRDKAFWGCSSLKCVTMLGSVTSIGEGAFPSKCRFITPVGNGDKVDKMVKKGENIVEEALTEQKKSELYDSFQTLFGKRIGDTISPYEIERNFYKNGKFHKEYVFTPRKPFLTFNRYIVKVTAQNHIVYSIRATAEYSPELYKMAKDAIEKRYQVWLHRWFSNEKIIENRYVWGVKGSLERLFNLQVIDNGDAGKEIVLEILDKQIEKTVESESFMDAVDAL